MECPSCGSRLEENQDIIGFDVRFFRCAGCGRRWSQTAGILQDLLGPAPLQEVNEKGTKRT
jgi:predicted Zn finger-like uncharacterized protein